MKNEYNLDIVTLVGTTDHSLSFGSHEKIRRLYHE